MGQRSDDDSAGWMIGILLGALFLIIIGGAALLMFRQAALVRRQAQAALLAEMRARDEAMAARNAAEMAAHGLPPEVGTDASGIPPAEAGLRSDNARLRAATGDIEEVLRAQESAWNAGDLETFMSHYWNSDRITFSSGGRITRGWNATIARYRQRYPTAEKMGKVSFQDLEITPLGEGVAMVLGQWRVDREPEPLRGNFTLVMQRFGGRWLIVHDHTSRWEDPEAATKPAEAPAKANERGGEL